MRPYVSTFPSSERINEVGALGGRPPGMLLAGESQSCREMKAHLQIGSMDASVHSPPSGSKAMPGDKPPTLAQSISHWGDSPSWSVGHPRMGLFPLVRTKQRKREPHQTECGSQCLLWCHERSVCSHTPKHPTEMETNEQHFNTRKTLSCQYHSSLARHCLFHYLIFKL